MAAIRRRSCDFGWKCDASTILEPVRSEIPRSQEVGSLTTSTMRDASTVVVRRLHKKQASLQLMVDLQNRALALVLAQVQNVAIVDDNKHCLATMQQQLAHLGYCSSTFDGSSFDAVVDHAQQWDSGVVLIDLCLGDDSDGRALAQQLRAATPATFLIAISASTPTDSGNIFALFDGILLKPVATSLKQLFKPRHK